MSAGLTLRNFYFRLYPGAVGELEVIDFPEGFGAPHRRPTADRPLGPAAGAPQPPGCGSSSSSPRITSQTEYLPPYAPELNPVEYIWAYWKQHELPNVCPKDYWELDERARKALRRMRRKPRLITAFWKQSSSLSRLTVYYARLSNWPGDFHRAFFLSPIYYPRGSEHQNPSLEPRSGDRNMAQGGAEGGTLGGIPIPASPERARGSI